MVEAIKCTKAAVYYNPNKKTPAAIMAETGCTHIMNGYLFNTRLQPLGWTVIDGKVISRDEYNDWGFCINNNEPIMNTNKAGSFLSGIPLLKNGEKLYRGLTDDVARKAERTAVGWTKDGLVVLWCDKVKMTRETLQDKMLSLGCVDALMFDGGGSTQGIFPGCKVTSSRKVPTLLLFWGTKMDTEPKGEKPMDFEIKAYSLKKEGEKYLTKNFQVKEFACKDGSDTVFIADKLPMVCQYIRVREGKSITPSNGYRTPGHNAIVGGEEFSMHLYGAAADLLTPKGSTPQNMAGYAREIMPDWGGVGIYSWGIHVDISSTKRDWNG